MFCVLSITFGVLTGCWWIGIGIDARADARNAGGRSTTTAWIFTALFALFLVMFFVTGGYMMEHGGMPALSAIYFFVLGIVANICGWYVAHGETAAGKACVIAIFSLVAVSATMASMVE